MDKYRRRLYIILSAAVLWSAVIIWTALHWDVVSPHLPRHPAVVPALLTLGLLSSIFVFWVHRKRGGGGAYALYNFLASCMLYVGAGALWLFNLPVGSIFVVFLIYLGFRSLAGSELKKAQKRQQSDGSGSDEVRRGPR